MRFLILFLFAMPVFADVPSEAETELALIVASVVSIAAFCLQAYIGWWAFKKILLVSISRGKVR